MSELCNQMVIDRLNGKPRRCILPARRWGDVWWCRRHEPGAFWNTAKGKRLLAEAKQRQRAGEGA